MKFQDLNIITPILKALSEEGYTEPTPIQEKAIPVILQHDDLLGCAQTGTGKTAAFAIPLLQLIYNKKPAHHIQCLILTPTRELAIQIGESFAAYGRHLPIKHLVIYGGVSQHPQTKSLDNGIEILIATPGRLLDLMQQGHVSLKHIEYFVLDEADRMLDMGFFDDIEKIISYLPKERQTLLFSATMPPKMRVLANKILKNPAQINIAISKPAEGILQQAYVVYETQKLPLLKSIMKNGSFKSAIIFAGTKEQVKKLEIELRRTNVNLKAFHSDLAQSEREEIMRAFKNNRLQVLIGTDILSRGIDVEGISLVINYDVPGDAEDYIHRIGRTARAETTGTAITFINERDQPKFFRIESLIGKEIDKIPLAAEFGEVPAYQPELKSEKPHRPNGGKKGGGKYKGNRFPKK